MLGKKGSSPDDDFDFDFGSDELFSLDDPFGNTKDKPPKGVKGYLKNVVKSVKNMGVSLGKIYLPAGMELVDNIKENDEDNPGFRQTLSKIKKDGSKYAKAAQDIVSDVGKDISKRVKTGYFFKSEDDSLSDIDFGMDDDFGDISFDENNDESEIPAPDSSENGEAPSERHKSNAIYAKSAKANALVSMRLSDAAINANIGIAQAQLQADTAHFNQSILMESEHHRQKMLVMKNIATNIGKVIKQNNISLKAQMEYSVKSLAFSNDIAAMLKEIRDSQWKLVTPINKDKEEVDLGTKNKIFGMGFNKKAFIENFKSHGSMNFMGGALDYIPMFKDMMGSMSGFGMKPSTMIQSMLGGMMFENLADVMLPGSLKRRFASINKSLEGAPMAINNILGHIGSKGFSDDSVISKFLGKFGKVGNFAKNGLQNLASYAHSEDMTITNTGRGSLGDPNAIHPFDNKAHKVLTEVIPMQLSAIEAGINNHEQTYFDFKSNQFKTISSMRNRIKNDRENVLEYSEGYSRGHDITGAILHDNDVVKKNNIDSNELSKNLIKNLFKSGIQLKKDELNELLKPNSEYNDKLLNELNLPDTLSDEEKQSIVKSFVDGLKKYSNDDEEGYKNFQQSAAKYATNLSKVNIDNERMFDDFGNSIAFDTITKNEELNRQKAKAERLYSIFSKQAEDLSKDNGGEKLLRKLKRDKILEQRKIITDIAGSKEGVIDSFIGENKDNNLNNETDYEIRSLKDTSSNSVVNNIYKLLLDGIIVYPKKDMDKDVLSRNELRKKVIKDSEESKRRELADKLDIERSTREAYAKEAEEIRNFKKMNYDEMFDKSAIQEWLENNRFTGKIAKKVNNISKKIEDLSVSKIDDVLNEQLYGIYKNKDGKSATEELKEDIVNKFNDTKDKVTNSSIYKAAAENTLVKKGNELAKKGINKAKSAYKVAKQALGGDLSVIKVGDKTLEEKIAEIKDSELLAKLNETKNPVEKAKIILNSGNEKVAEYKEKLNEYIDKREKENPNSKLTKVFVKGRKIFKAAAENTENIKTKSVGMAKEFYSDKIKSHFDQNFTNEIDRKEGSIKDQKLDAKEAEEAEQKRSQTKSLGTIAATLTAFFKDGFKLNKDDMKKFDENSKELKESVDNAAEKSDEKNGGILGKVNDLIDKTGLGDTKGGQAVKSALNKAQGYIDTSKNVVGKLSNSKIGKMIAHSKVGTIVTGIGGGVTGIFKNGALKSFTKGGVKGFYKHATRSLKKGAIKAFGKNATKSTAKTVAKGALKNKGIIGKFIGLLEKFFGLVFKNPKFGKACGKSTVSFIIKSIKANIPKILGKIMGKVVSAISFLSSGVGALIKFGVGFINGTKNVRKSLGLGNDMRPTIAMTSICALATGLDLVLSGIPTLIAKMVGYKNFAQFIYDKIGSKEEKAAIERYRKFCAMKALIYGIKESVDGFIQFQNRDVLDKAGRVGLQILTLGLAKSNDDKDASLLGFSSKQIYKYWKENKYEPLEKLRKEVAEAYGGLKVVEKMETFTADKNNDGQIGEDEQEKADEQQQRIANQQAYRKDFLNQARKWVIENKLAWLHNKVSIEEFKKRTGKNADTIKSSKEKFGNAMKKTGAAIKKYGVAAVLAGPLGVAAQIGITKAWKNRKAIKDGAVKFGKAIGSGTVKAVKATGKAFATAGTKIADVTVDLFNKGKQKAKDFGKAIANKASQLKDWAIDKKDKLVNGAKKLGKSVVEGISKLGGKILDTGKKCIDAIEKFFSKLLKTTKLAKIRCINAIRNAIAKVISTIKDASSKIADFGKKLSIQTLMLTAALPLTIIRGTSAFMKGFKNPGKFIGFEVEEKTEKIKAIGAVISVFSTLFPLSNQACITILGKTLRRVIFEIIIGDTEESKKDTYLEEKAKILGLTVPNMLAYENKLNESNFGKKAIAFMSNIFGGGADRKDASICGFSDVSVFKFWREEKYEPLRNIEETTAHKFGDIDDLRSESPKDPDAQQKFRTVYLREARKYVKDRGLGWLTYKTTKKELDERKKTKTLYLKTDKEVQKEKAEEKQGFFQKAKNFFFSKNRDTRGNANQEYQNNNSKGKNRNVADIENADTKAMEESLRKEYKYDKKAMSVMAQASNSIKSFWKSISPNFYGDQEPAKVSSDMKVNDKVYGGNGGLGGVLTTSEGLITKFRDRVIDNTKKGTNIVKNKTRDVINNVSDKVNSKLSSTYNMSGEVPKAVIMNSIVSDFAKNFGKELNKRLDILQEMHKENLRHNKVSEEFFISALKMLQMIAANSNQLEVIASNNKSNSSNKLESQLGDMINNLIR